VLASQALIAQARQHRPGESVDREVTDPCTRIAALIEAWRGQPPAETRPSRRRPRCTGSERGLSKTFILAIDEHTAGRVSELDLALRIADASADVEHAVGARLTREPLLAD
jgi:hypothetical protein